MKKRYIYISITVVLVITIALIFSRSFLANFRELDNDLKKFCENIPSTFKNIEDLNDSAKDIFTVFRQDKNEEIGTMSIKTSNNPFEFNICFIEFNKVSQVITKSWFISD